jgi:uncharacterized protein (TIGR02611 family)
VIGEQDPLSPEGGVAAQTRRQRLATAVDRRIVRIRANPVGHLALRIAVAVVGLVVVVVGIILVPLPGPGWLIVFTGLAIWAIEYTWARQLLYLAVQQVASWKRWYAALRPQSKILVGTVTFVFTAAIVLGVLFLSVGPVLWDWLTTS